MWWQRVDIQEASESQSESGAVISDWDTYLSDEEARLLPLVHDERTQAWATPEEQAYEVHLRGALSGIEPRMRVVADGDYFDIRQVIQPPPFGTPVTVLQTVRVLP